MLNKTKTALRIICLSALLLFLFDTFIPAGIVGLIFYIAIIMVPALSAILTDDSWDEFFRKVFVSVFGIVVPLLFYFLSMFLLPEWKGAAPNGWIDTFQAGKIALAPFVFWAFIAFYAVEVLQVQDQTRWQIVIGLFLGSIVGIVYFIHLCCFNIIPETEILPMLLALYPAAWYSYLAIKLIRAAAIPRLTYMLSFFGSLPFWIFSISLSKQIYLELPDESPACFIVSAAMNGHKMLVRPFIAEGRNGKLRQMNYQLLTFWQLEMLWTAASPQTHRKFRRIYNAVGPMIAARISTALAADLMYLVLKPAELIAACIVRLAKK